MRKLIRLMIWSLVILLAAASSARAQSQYIGYVYPAGGQQGTTFPIRLGGQALAHASGVVVSGEGVSGRLVDYYRVMNNQEIAFLNQQLNELKKGAVLSDDLVARMAWFEFPAAIGPMPAAGEGEMVVCPVCGQLNKAGDRVCRNCGAVLPQPQNTPPGKTAAPKPPVLSEKDLARERMIERIQMRFAQDERNPAVRSQTELVFAEITVAPNAKPGRREIRVLTRRGLSNPLPFYVGQVPEVARKPMKTCQLPVLGKEYLALRKRPPEEEELRITVPCTTNGQIAPGEVNRYRFAAHKGEHLVIQALARELGPYVADAVPGWFQAALRLCDADGHELAYNDDFRSNPDPLIYFTVPADGEYVLTIHEALFRGRESFVYRITIGAVPFITSIFPLGGRVGAPVKIEMAGWNLTPATLAPPSPEAGPGVHLLAATAGKFVSNAVPFALDTLPECFKDPGNDPQHPQKVTLPIIINGRVERPGGWDVFAVEGKAGATLVAEVCARRLGSPLDSFLKVTSADGRIIAFNDDHFDAASGLNTDHADSYLMVTLPADGKYFVHLGDTRRQAGKEFAYRLRLSPPQPDFALRVLPSRIALSSKASASVTVYAIRKDGFDGPINLNFKNLPAGFQSPGATLAAKQEVVGLTLKTSLTALEQPVNLTIVGTAKAGDREIIHDAVPAEDKMQAFLWRHLLAADTLPVVVFDPAYQSPTERLRPAIRDEDRPKGVQPTLTRASVETYVREIEGLYQEWFLTDEFVNREIATTEARLIK